MCDSANYHVSGMVHNNEPSIVGGENFKKIFVCSQFLRRKSPNEIQQQQIQNESSH